MAGYSLFGNYSALTVVARGQQSQPVRFSMSARVLSAIAFSTALALAPFAHADRYHGGWHGHGGGAAVGAAIAGGLIGLGLGAAAASNPYYYSYAPPPVYYGYPYGYYYAPPPPVYYGY